MSGTKDGKRFPRLFFSAANFAFHSRGSFSYLRSAGPISTAGMPRPRLRLVAAKNARHPE